MLAARTGNVALATRLVQRGADVNRRERFREQSAVMWAAAQNHPEMVAFLISKGADLTVRAQANDWETQISSEPRVQYRPTGGLTPLLYAARAGCLGCVKAMLDAGADKDRPNPDGMTPMIMALDNGYPAVAQQLLDRGANPHTWDWWGRTPLYVAVTMRGGLDGRAGSRSPESLAFIKALLATGVNVERAARVQGAEPRRTRQSLQGRSAHHRRHAAAARRADLRQRRRASAARARRARRSAECLRCDAVHGRGWRRHTHRRRCARARAFPTTSSRSRSRRWRSCGQAGADVNARITDVTSLTARIARANTLTGRQGQTTLFFAAESGRTEVVKYLLEHGAKTDLVDDMGKAPIDLVANGRGDRAKEIATLLQNTRSR